MRIARDEQKVPPALPAWIVTSSTLRRETSERLPWPSRRTSRNSMQSVKWCGRRLQSSAHGFDAQSFCKVARGNAAGGFHHRLHDDQRAVPKLGMFLLL